MGRYNEILRKPWLSTNNPHINFRTIEVQGSTQIMTSVQRSRSSGNVECLLISRRQARQELKRGRRNIMAWVALVEERSTPASNISIDKDQSYEPQNLLDTKYYRPRSTSISLTVLAPTCRHIPIFVRHNSSMKWFLRHQLL